jgi:hypothetical protein
LAAIDAGIQLAFEYGLKSAPSRAFRGNGMRRLIVLFLLLVSSASVGQATEYKRSLPLDNLSGPLIVPPGSELTLQKDPTFRNPDPAMVSPPPTGTSAVPMIGITIKPPTEERK